MGDRSYVVGPESGRLLVKTARTWLGAKAGHDLTIEVTGWHGKVTVDTSSPARSSVVLELDVDSLEAREGTGGVKPLTDSDRADIKDIIRAKILCTERYPTISFRSRRVSGRADAFRIEGDLTIMSVTKPITVDGQLHGDRARGSATVVQSRWGIRPYSALLGALKLRDEVEILFDVELTTAA